MNRALVTAPPAFAVVFLLMEGVGWCPPPDCEEEFDAYEDARDLHERVEATLDQKRLERAATQAAMNSAGARLVSAIQDYEACRHSIGDCFDFELRMIDAEADYEVAILAHERAVVEVAVEERVEALALQNLLSAQSIYDACRAPQPPPPASPY